MLTNVFQCDTMFYNNRRETMTSTLIFERKQERLRQECRVIASFLKQGWSKSEIARHTGKSITWVTDRITIIEREKGRK
jgi:hypothetical protein